jgi:hypothetical protein
MGEGWGEGRDVAHPADSAVNTPARRKSRVVFWWEVFRSESVFLLALFTLTPTLPAIGSWCGNHAGGAQRGMGDVWEASLGFPILTGNAMSLNPPPHDTVNRYHDQAWNRPANPPR